VNGGFETGDFSGWSLSGNLGGFSGVDHGTTGFAPGAKSGSYAAFFGPIGNPVVLSQDVATTPGTSYKVSFFLANDGAQPNEFQVSWNGAPLLYATNLPAFGYTYEAFPHLLATVETTKLAFRFLNESGNFHMDDVYVGAGAVPEPTTLVLCATTVGGLAVARWRRRR
jgi:hypothetical protein